MAKFSNDGKPGVLYDADGILVENVCVGVDTDDPENPVVMSMVTLVRPGGPWHIGPNLSGNGELPAILDLAIGDHEITADTP